MKILKSVKQGEVFSHWERVEKISILNRQDIVLPLLAYNDLVWNITEIEDADINKIFICSSDDWLQDGLCIPDFRLGTAIANYKKSDFSSGKYADIKAKENIFEKDLNELDTKLILVADNPEGPYTLIEGCKRSVALGNLGKLASIKVYLGVSSYIRTYVWARYMYKYGIEKTV